MSPWWLRLGPYIRPHTPRLALVMLLMSAGVAIEALKPWPMKLLVDHVLTRAQLPWGAGWILMLPGGNSPGALLGWLAGSTVLLFVAAQAFQIGQRYVEAGVSTRMVYDVGNGLFSHLQQLCHARFYARHRTGDLVRRVTSDSGCARDLIMTVVLPILTSVGTLVTMVAVMWRLDRSLSLIALVVACPLGMIMKIMSGPMAARHYERNQIEGEMLAVAEQDLTTVPMIQAFDRCPYEVTRFRELSDRTLRAYLRTLGLGLQFKVGTSGVTAIGTAAIMIVGGFHVVSGALSIGSLLVFLSYLASLYAPLETLAYISSGYASAAAGARRVLEVLDIEEGVRDNPGARPLPTTQGHSGGHIRLEQVTVGYERGRPVLCGVNLEARPGETVAVVGATGGGKSTLMSLIPRFLDPWEGRVMLDGVNIRSIQLSSLRAHIAVVLQEPFLLPLTVAENIAYGRPGAGRSAIEAAARAANADEFIQTLPAGYDTSLGERGVTLSNGQRQRLAIARALLKDAPVLILDEPTAALDAETERLLMAALEELMRGRTTFIVAHRLSTVRRADRIAVLDLGRIVEIGSEQELLALDGTYRRLHDIQYPLVGV